MKLIKRKSLLYSILDHGNITNAFKKKILISKNYPCKRNKSEIIQIKLFAVVVVSFFVKMS